MLNLADSEAQLDLDLGSLQVLEQSDGSRAEQARLTAYGWAVVSVTS
jgi:hypothetical protein